jgi:hypothetical protein
MALETVEPHQKNAPPPSQTPSQKRLIVLLTAETRKRGDAKKEIVIENGTEITES